MITLNELNERIKVILSPKLRDMGFKGSKGKYIRVIDGVINCICVQKNKYGEKYTIELGAHYTFLPSLLNKEIEENKYTVYDCEFNKRLSSDNSDKWWDYGVDIEETDKILNEVLILIKNEGENFFNLFISIPKEFIEIDIKRLNESKKIIDKYGVHTNTRFVLLLARLFTHIVSFDRADEFINEGIKICEGKPVLQEIFINLRSTRKI